MVSTGMLTRFNHWFELPDIEGRMRNGSSEIDHNQNGERTPPEVSRRRRGRGIECS